VPDFQEALQGLHPVLGFRPWPNGDPGPAIYEEIKEKLSSAQREQFVGALIGIEAAMTEARLSGLKQLQEIVAGRGEG
jgi:hypothetical protein